MRIVKKFKLPYAEGDSWIDLPPNRSREANRSTGLIGPNGTRKSFLLRAILDNAMREIARADDPSRDENRTVEFERIPARIIAISAVPTDRFPSKPAPERRLISRYDFDHYQYIGQRSSGNILSRTQALRTLVLALTRHRQTLAKRKSFLSHLCEQTGILTQFVVAINFTTRSIDWGAASTDSIDPKPAICKESDTVAHFAQSDVGIALLAKLMSRQHSHVPLSRGSTPEKRLDRAKASPFKLRFNLASGTIESLDGFKATDLSWGIRMGIIRPTALVVETRGGELMTQDEMSAGQWSLFSTLTTLALEARDDSLILIDEPENSLHPGWQQTYMESVASGLAHVGRCHVIVATHSPLVISGLNSKTSEIIDLQLSTSGEVSASLSRVPEGWNASTILEDIFDLDSARGPDLTRLANEALQLISEGGSQNRIRLRKLCERLMPFEKNLPDGDPAKPMIAAIIKTSRSWQ